MKVWTVVNQKGGVGKTTSAISIAGSLAAMSHNVLLIDLDPHASLTHYLGIDSDQLALSVYDLFALSQHPHMLNELLSDAVLNSGIKKIDLLPAHMALATLDSALSNQAGKGLIVKKVVEHLKTHAGMKAAGKKYDYVIIDCQPVLGILMVNALVAADIVVIPTQTEHLAMHGLNKMLSTISQMRNSLSPDLVSLIVPTLFDRRVNACLRSFAVMRKVYPDKLWRGYIPVDTKFRDASAQGLPINIVAPNAKGSFAYEKLVGALLKYD